MNAYGNHIMVTGFPTATVAPRLVEHVLAEDSQSHLHCIVPENFLPTAQAWLARRRASERERVTLLKGDAASVDLGLSGSEYNDLSQHVTHIHHCAAVTYGGVDPRRAEAVNVGATREVLELAESCVHIARVVHWSSTWATGARHGGVTEEDLTEPEGGPIHSTRYRAERLIREAGVTLPVTILRPSMIVGDSRTGETERFDGPYALMLAMLDSPEDVSLPVPGNGNAKLNAVPIDYVVQAGLLIGNAGEARGKTYHLVDSEPPTVREVLEKLAELTGRPAPSRVLPESVTSALVKTPGLKKLTQAPRALMEELGRDVVYDDRNARTLLRPAGIECPPLLDYLSKLLSYMEEQRADPLSTLYDR